MGDQSATDLPLLFVLDLSQMTLGSPLPTNKRIVATSHPDQRAVMYTLACAVIALGHAQNSNTDKCVTISSCVIQSGAMKEVRLGFLQVSYPLISLPIEVASREIDNYIDGTLSPTIMGVDLQPISRYIRAHVRRLGPRRSHADYISSVAVHTAPQHNTRDTLTLQWGISSDVWDYVDHALGNTRLSRDSPWSIVRSLFVCKADRQTGLSLCSLLATTTPCMKKVFDIAITTKTREAVSTLLLGLRTVYLLASVAAGTPLLLTVNDGSAFSRLCSIVAEDDDAPDAAAPSLQDRIEDKAFSAAALCLTVPPNACHSNTVMMYASALLASHPHILPTWMARRIKSLLLDAFVLLRPHYAEDEAMTFALMSSYAFYLDETAQEMFNIREFVTTILCGNQNSYFINNVFEIPIVKTPRGFASQWHQLDAACSNLPSEGMPSFSLDKRTLRVPARLLCSVSIAHDTDLIRYLYLIGNTFAATFFSDSLLLSGFSLDFKSVCIPSDLLECETSSPFYATAATRARLQYEYPLVFQVGDMEYLVHSTQGSTICTFCARCMAHTRTHAVAVPVAVLTGDLIFCSKLFALAFNTLYEKMRQIKILHGKATDDAADMATKLHAQAGCLNLVRASPY
jgi:hypothetical protein